MAETRMIAGYGWKRSLPDPRDLHADPSGLTVLDEVDPRVHMPLIYDQGQLGSCTANAVAAAFEYDRALDGLGLHRPSRLFIYYCERQIEGSLGQGDTGAYGRDGFKALQNYGAPLETQWKYVVGRFDEQPPANVWADAEAMVLTKLYKAVPRDVDAWKAVLSNRQTIAFGFSVFESFERTDVISSGMVPLPAASEAMLGGHEVLAIGYLRDYPNHVLCRNSWGRIYSGLAALTSASKHPGYFLMPWDYVLDAQLADDFRTIVRPA